ncbi:hypothetical protein DFO73_101504 [Cytobacillus oceanisediminis]|uniref:Tetratricopeptide repeat protein n=1 Tax=Cytobacillus oceanisediminis TaxID=665099 RepID=A0A2V3A7T7_9BACI|nr:hypothetical protein DFO73_101504 [Cytobacillus oceanisediminis]
MNTNQKSLEYFEQNEYEKALKLFKCAGKESRDIQSLNNLAWMYLYEEENDGKAFGLIQEVILMNPNSYFPYNMLETKGMETCDRCIEKINILEMNSI